MAQMAWIVQRERRERGSHIWEDVHTYDIEAPARAALAAWKRQEELRENLHGVRVGDRFRLVSLVP